MKLLPCSLASGEPSGAASYADQNEASPSLGAANCETVTAFVGSCEVSGVASHADQNAASPSVEAAICDTVATFVCCWRVQRSGDADQNQASPPLRAANGKTVATCGGVSGGPASSRPSRIRMRPCRPCGLRTAKLSPLAWAPGGPSGMTSYADQNETAPPLGHANCETVATFVAPPL